MKTRILIGISLLASLLLATVPAYAEDPKELNLGVTPLESAQVMYKQFAPLAKYLQKELGMPVNIVVGKNYQDAVDALGKNEVQVSYLTPTLYPKCEKMFPDAKIKPIVRFLEGGQGAFKACILVPADSDVKELAQLKGKAFGFGNKDSTSSHLMPRAMLKKAGIDPEKDCKSVEYLGSHSNVAAAVKLKKVDAGAAKDSVADKAEKAGEAKIIARSDLIPEFPICVNKNVSDELAGKIKKAILKLSDKDEEAKKILTAINAKYTGAEETADKDYDIMRSIIKDLYGDDFYKRTEEKK